MVDDCESAHGVLCVQGGGHSLWWLQSMVKLRGFTRNSWLNLNKTNMNFQFLNTEGDSGSLGGMNIFELELEKNSTSIHMGDVSNNPPIPPPTLSAPYSSCSYPSLRSWMRTATSSIILHGVEDSVEGRG